MSAHTPGPWNQHIDRGVKQTTVVAAGNKLVAVALWDANEQWQHNVRLIAAAPDLLEALQELEKEFRKTYPIYYYAEPWAHETNVQLQKARAAIAKATGEDA